MFRSLKQRLMIIAAGLCALLVMNGFQVPLLNAQTPSVKQPSIATLDTFLDAHPNIEKDLEHNPGLLKDSAYLTSHPELKTFLANHPAIATDADKNPKALMKRLDKFERSGRDISKADLSAFDEFMDKHSDLEKQVHKNPALLTNADFLAKNPDLKTFLAAHPSIQHEITENPRVFMKAENHFEHREDRLEHQQAKLEHKAATPPLHHPMGGPHR
jgi:hypothetical protein